MPAGLYRQVWYDTKEDGESTTDYVLEDGDKIHVSKTVFLV